MYSWRRIAAGLAMVTLLSGLTACSDTGITKTDAYSVGCPALDAVVGGGALGTKAAVAALKKIREQPDLDQQTQRWLDAAIGGLSTTDPNKMPAEAKALLVDGCEQNGYPLRNLRA
jgi:hypothetical protein